MATTKVDSGNIQLRQQGGVPMRQIEPRPVQYFAGKVQAEYGQAMGQILDRMSSGLFEYAGKLRSEEGLKWAAENQITEQQLIDMKGGVDVDIGAGRIVRNGKVEKSLASMLPSKFNEAVVKARSAELAFKLEQQGISEMVKMLEGIDRGDPSASSKNIIEKLNTITNAHYEVLVGVDPAAANRYNATMATHGNTVYKAALKAESEYNKRIQGTKFDNTFNEVITLNERALKTNPKALNAIVQTGFEQLRQSAITERIGFEAANKYFDEYKQKTRDFKLDAIKQELRKEEYLNDPSKTRAAILSGNLGDLSEIAKEFLSDSKAIEDISKEFNIYVSYKRQDKQDADKALKESNHKKANTLIFEFHQPQTSAQRKKQITIALVDMDVLSPEQIEHYTKPEVKEGDPYAFAAIENQIVFGDITDSNQLKRITQRMGINGTQFARLNSRLLDGVKKDDTDARRLIRRFAGTPDIVSSFATKDDEAKINKELTIVSYYENNIKEFRKISPGVEVPYNELALKAKEKYEQIDKADVTKNAARKSIEGITKDLIESKKLPKGIVIDENTNINDLKTKYKLKDADVDILIKKQNAIKGIK
jgi:hypothetical protein